MPANTLPCRVPRGVRLGVQLTNAKPNLTCSALPTKCIGSFRGPRATECCENQSSILCRILLTNKQTNKRRWEQNLLDRGNHHQWSAYSSVIYHIKSSSCSIHSTCAVRSTASRNDDSGIASSQLTMGHILWAMIHVTHQSIDPWLTTTHQSLSQCDVCVPQGEGRKYRCDLDFIPCLYALPLQVHNKFSSHQLIFFPKISTEFEPSQGNLCVFIVVCSSLATLLQRSWKGSNRQSK